MTNDDVKKKQESKLRFEIDYAGENALNSMAFLDKAGDERTRELVYLLNKVYEEAKRIKERDYSFPKTINKDTREALQELVGKTQLDCSFGDGMEQEMVYHGAYFTGVVNMSDEELIEEAEHYYGEDEEFGGDEIELIKKAKAELALNTALDA